MPRRNYQELLELNRQLQSRLEEAEETLRALRLGEVDAVVASGPDGEQVYTLHGADEAYRVMVQTMAEGAVTLTTDGLVLFANEQFAELLRMPLEQVIGSPLMDFVAPESVSSVSALLGGRGSRKVEATLRTGSGALVPVYLSVQNIVLGGEGCLCLIVTDLSEQKRNQEIAAVMEAVPAAVFIAHDPECRHMLGNRMANRLLRVPPETNVSKSAPDVQLPPRWREMKDGTEIRTEDLPLQTAARTGLPVQDYEFDLVFEDGTSQSLLGNAVPLFDEMGRPRGAVAAFVDVTEHKRSAERLQQAQKMESLGLLAGGLAHDFNNLLVGVIGNASMAQRLLPSGNEAIVLLDRITSAGEQLANLTRQMLAYAGKGQSFPETLDLSEVIERMSALLQSSIPKKVLLDFDLQPDLPPVKMDHGRLQQVILNLVMNAAEAIGESAGRITVRSGALDVDEKYIQGIKQGWALSPGAYVCLEVRDTGCGMAPETVARIFDPFFTTKFLGRGLGLAAVSGIVRTEKGAIRVTSVPSGGSCFTVLFPALHRTPAPEQTVVSLPRHTVSETVLFVDDEEIVRDMAKMALTRYGFGVLLAKDGIEAIEVLQQHIGAVSIIVLDLSMPRMRGEEALPELRKISPAVKVVVSSGYTENETMALFKDQQVSGFLQKPYTATTLAERVKSVLD